MTKTRFHGSCHCGALVVLFIPRQAPSALPLQACPCAFCRRHAARTTCDPSGQAVIVVRQREALKRYRWGLAPTDHLVCGRCGVYVAAHRRTEERALATLNVNALEDPGRAFERAAAPVSCEGESADDGRPQRQASGTPAVLVFPQPTRLDAPAAAPLMAAYFEELNRLLGGFDPTLSVSANPGELAPPVGTFLTLVDEEDRPLACGGLKTHSPGVGEIKRMFVLPHARGHSLGWALLHELEDEARRLGLKRVVLDTAAPLAAAARLYQGTGYEEVAPFNDNPYAARWFAKTL